MRPKEHRTDNLGDKVVHDRHLHHACEQSEDRAFELGVLVAHEDRKADEEQADQEQRKAPANRPLQLGQGFIKTQPHAERRADIPEHDQW